MIRRLLAALVLGLLVAGCGEGGGEARGRPDATASLWVTRDHGSEVVFTATVPAGLTVMQALEREADVKTAYGGRFVQAINGIEGNKAEQVDWFYFVNGIEADVGAADVRLRPGDVAWWDYRSWRERMSWPVVVGAFPEPFRHGWSGRRRPVDVRFPPALAREAQALRDVLAARGGKGEANVFALDVRPGEEGAALTASRRGPTSASPVVFRLVGSLEAVRAAARVLARDPSVVRFRYVTRFDESGKVIG